MKLRLQVDYVFDGRGRMLTTNEPSEDVRKVAPAVVVGATSLGNVVHLRTDVPDEIAHRIAHLSDYRDLGELSSLILRELAPLGQCAQQSGPAYRFPESDFEHSGAVEITAESLSLVDEHFDWLRREYENWGPCYVAVREGNGVATCFSSRRNERAAEVGVWTAPDYRGQGLAPIVTASWADSLSRSGRIPFYGTSSDNVSSQRVAAKLGLQKIGEELTFVLNQR